MQKLEKVGKFIKCTCSNVVVVVVVVVGPRRDAYKPLVRLKRLTQLAAFKYMGVFQSRYLDFLLGVVLCVLIFCGYALVSVYNIKGFMSFYHCTSDPQINSRKLFSGVLLARQMSLAF